MQNELQNKRIRKGDRVLVLAGNDKGKTGEVLSRSEDRVLIQGVNVRKKHLRHTQQTQQMGQKTGRIIDREVPIHISNVALCTAQGERLKIKVKQAKDGRKLVHGAAGKETVYRTVKKPA
jgi:large subunit ribosomal protein L24